MKTLHEFAPFLFIGFCICVVLLIWLFEFAPTDPFDVLEDEDA